MRLRIAHHRVLCVRFVGARQSPLSVVVRQGKFWELVKREEGGGEAFAYDDDMKKRLRGIMNHLTTCSGGFGAAFAVSAVF